MSLQQQLEELTTKLNALVPAERLASIDQEIKKLKSSGISQGALKAGDTAPGFELYDGDGMLWRSPVVLRNGSLVVVFYRGRWCA
jgi:hypothetical protein